MKTVWCLLMLLVGRSLAVAQSDTTQYVQEITRYQQALDEEYAEANTSPLLPKDRKQFRGLPFYPIDAQYCVTATFVRTPGSRPFAMPTSNPRRTIYEKYGEAHFTFDGTAYILPIYQSHELRATEKYRDHLFLPFTDLTSGSETYGGGRYLELTIPEGDSIIVDFNKAYHPYCAYNPKYACPIPPRENHLPIAIRAGVRLEEDQPNH